MNQEVKQQWVAALRSGNYQQGKKKLCKNDDGVIKHCCLGVLTDLFVKAHPTTYEWNKLTDLYFALATKGKTFGVNYLPKPVVDWAGLESDSPSALKEYSMINLASENDEGASFAEIADIIEAHL